MVYMLTLGVYGGILMVNVTIYIAYVNPMGYIMDGLGVPHQHITWGGTIL